MTGFHFTSSKVAGLSLRRRSFLINLQAFSFSKVAAFYLWRIYFEYVRECLALIKLLAPICKKVSFYLTFLVNLQASILVLLILVCMMSEKHLVNTVLKEVHCTLLLPHKKWKTSKWSNYDDFIMLQVSFLAQTPHILLLKIFFFTSREAILTVFGDHLMNTCQQGFLNYTVFILLKFQCPSLQIFLPILYLLSNLLYFLHECTKKEFFSFLFFK